MPRSFPLDRSSFLELVGAKRVSFSLGEAVRTSPTRGGELLRAGTGTRLWGGRLIVSQATAPETERAVALMELLLEPGASFLAYRLRQVAPALDPTGAGLGAATPVIGSVAANNREIAVSGLPGGYRLSQGDFVSWSYDGGRRALHRVVTDRTATGGGAIAALELSPVIEPGVSAGTPLTLVRPACTAVLVPGTYSPPEQEQGVTLGWSVEWRQTLVR